MSILGDVDIEVSCDECGTSANVDVSNAVTEKLRRRGWKSGVDGETCEACCKSHENSDKED